MFELTQAQLDFVDAFGYLHFPGVLAPRIEAITEAHNALMYRLPRRRGREQDERPGRISCCPFMEHDAYLCTLLDEEHMHGVASALLGPDYQFSAGDGNHYVQHTSWHSMSWPNPLRYYKFALYLDPTTRDTGSLRVIPGSHRVGEPFAEELDSRLQRVGPSFGAADDELPSVAIETQPGDLLVFNQAIKHSAFGGVHRRHMSINYHLHADTPELVSKLETRRLQQGYCWSDVFGTASPPPLLANAPAERLRHLEHLQEFTPQERMGAYRPQIFFTDEDGEQSRRAAADIGEAEAVAMTTDHHADGPDGWRRFRASAARL